MVVEGSLHLVISQESPVVLVGSGLLVCPMRLNRDRAVYLDSHHTRRVEKDSLKV